MSLGLIVLSALTASSIAGSASSRSAWTSSTCFCTTSASACATAASAPTEASWSRTPGSFSSISAMSASVSSCDCFRTGCRSVSSCCIEATLDSADASWVKPLPYLFFCWSTSSLRWPSAILKATISSRYDVGVTYVMRPADDLNSAARVMTSWWKFWHASTIAGRKMLSRSTSARNLSATATRASPGHAVNQSMAQQLTSDGNLRRRSLNASPMGENARMMWSCCLTRWTKNAKSWRGVMSAAARPNFSRAKGRTSSQMATFSSFGKRFGTSPEFNMLLMSSTNDSEFICVSLNKNTSGRSPAPASRSTALRSSRHSTWP
mmetsp:Transcript_25199/g.84728  ORF Transcript_25199/g.84728 Transcript_25199/m.84728 type:complete len:321 (-) Transcript_25199:604-1566(-)